MKKRLAIIVALALIMQLVPVFNSSAASSKPGTVKVTYARAATAPAKVGKGTVTVKWNKVSGATGYQIFVKRTDGKWKKVLTVKGSKKSAKVKAYVGKNRIRVRAIRKKDGETLYGKYSAAKAVTVTSKRTVQSYIKKNPKVDKQIRKEAKSSGMTVKFRYNDIIYTYDLANIIDDENIVGKELKDSLNDALNDRKGEFVDLCSEIEKSLKVGGVRIIVRYTYNGKLVIKKAFS